jgi:hypothetical protein
MHYIVVHARAKLVWPNIDRMPQKAKRTPGKTIPGVLKSETDWFYRAAACATPA